MVIEFLNVVTFSGLARLFCVVVVLSSFACTADNVSNDVPDDTNSNKLQSVRELLQLNERKWNELNIKDYDFELSASGYLLAFDSSVTISVRNGDVESIRKSDGKEVSSTRIYKQYSTVERIFKFLKEVEAKNPYRLFVAYDEIGFPTYVDLDEVRGIADDELTLRLSNLQIRE